MEYTPGQFSSLVHQRQELVYKRGLTHTSESVQAIDTVLSEIAHRSIYGLIIELAQPHGQLNNMNIDTIGKWIRFYQKPKIVRQVLEKLNQVLGYGRLND